MGLACQVYHEMHSNIKSFAHAMVSAEQTLINNAKGRNATGISRASGSQNFADCFAPQ